MGNCLKKEKTKDTSLSNHNNQESECYDCHFLVEGDRRDHINDFRIPCAGSNFSKMVLYSETISDTSNAKAHTKAIKS